MSVFPPHRTSPRPSSLVLRHPPFTPAKSPVMSTRLAPPQPNCWARLLLRVLTLLPLLYGGAVHAQTVIDVAVFYTPEAKTAWGGTDGIRARIDEIAAATNMAYVDSGVNQRIHLVAVEEVAYHESGDIAKYDLPRLREPRDGYMDEVHTIRDQTEADIVMLLRSRPDDSPAALAGAAYIINVLSLDAAPWAFGVSTVDAPTFVHELGHIMGLDHDRYAACAPECPDSVTPYAYGYVNQEMFDLPDSTTVAPGVPSSKRWRTIMALSYRCFAAGPFCPSILRFSNPDQRYPDADGDPLGVPGTRLTHAVDGPANAVRTLNRTRTTVAQYRSSQSVKVRFGEATATATEGGSAASVKVQLDAAPGRTLDIPLTVDTATSDAWTSDYSGVPDTIQFTATQTERTVTVTAVDDSFDENNETLTLGFGDGLPLGVTVDTAHATTTVTLEDNDTVDGAPQVSDIQLTSDPGSDGVYGAGDEIEITVVFTKTVTVTGSPQLEVTLGSETRSVTLRAHAGEVLVFAYTVADGDRATGLSIAANSLTGTIRDGTPTGTPQAAELAHDSLAAPALLVEGHTPVLESAVADGHVLTLTYDEALDATAVPASDAFTVRAGSEAVAVAAVEVSGSVVTLRLDAHVLHGQAVTLDYTPGTPPLQDPSGNAVAGLSGEPVENRSPEPVYDTDANGLIEIETWAQLDAVRYDLDGDGIPVDTGALAYAGAFPEAGARLTCGTSSGCGGYELTAALDFDTNGDGRVDAADEYWNAGAGWQPIGTSASPFAATFAGNGHIIRHLFIKRGQDVGLFGVTAGLATLRHVGVAAAEVGGSADVGGLVGSNAGVITGSYVTGSVTGVSDVGGLAGSNVGGIVVCYATARVSGTTRTGGLVGANGGTITASYATGRVSGTGGSSSRTGGLVGANSSGNPGEIRVSYATGLVSGATGVGGLVGANDGGTITLSYWDTDTSGQTSGSHEPGRSTIALQFHGLAGLFVGWNVDVDGDALPDDPWVFRPGGQYPALKVDVDGDGSATWREFGFQARKSPTLTADTATSGQVDLSWTAVNVSPWSPAPAVTYTIYRDTGSAIETVAQHVSGLQHTTTGPTGTYQVAAVVDGGEAVRSGWTAVVTPNQAPAFPPTEDGTRSVAENTAANRNIGAPVAATDVDGDTLTYSLGGTDAASFTINTSTGRLRTKAALDYETKARYRVTVSVHDGVPDTTIDATINVTIMVTNLDEAGMVELSSSTPQEKQALTATLSDLDGELRNINWQWARSTDRNTWTDTGETSNPYTPQMGDVGQYLRATASYTDGHGMGKAEAATTTARVQAAPQVSLALFSPSITEKGGVSTVTATLDRAVRVETRVTVSATAVSPAVAADFTVSGSTLTIPAHETSSEGTVTLTAQDNDVDGPETKEVSVTGTTNALVTAPDAVTLTITDDDTAPEVELVLSVNPVHEGETSQVTARLSHPSSAETVVTLTARSAHYTLSGLTLRIAPGQMDSNAVTLTAADNSVDEAATESTVSGTAENDRGVANTSVEVRLTLTDDDPPEVSGRATVRYTEGATRPVATYTATNPENVTLEWSLAGPDAGELTIDATGRLHFRNAPDFEQPRDDGENNVYEVTVQATDDTTLSGATLTGSLDVAITVEDAPGTVRLSPTTPQVGTLLTATLTDPDGVEEVTAWCWEISSLSTFPDTPEHPITELGCSTSDLTTTAPYTPVTEDVNHYLRVTATYTDKDGTTNKTGIGVSAAVVSARPVSRPAGQPPGGGGGGGGPGGGSGGGGGGGGGGEPACAEDMHGNSAAQATVIPLATETPGALCPATDVDYFTVTAPGRGLLFVDTPGGVPLRGTLWQDGAVVAAGPTRGSEQEDRLGARVQAGTVVVALQGQGGARGPYTLVVTFVRGVLENPGHPSFQSGVGVLSGWVCAAEVVELALAHLPVQVAGYGTERRDTAGVCGDTDNGFGLLFNWNLLEDGEHAVVAFVDGVELGRATVTVTTLGEEFLRGAEGACVVEDFPRGGQRVRLVWQQNSQNFVIAGGSPPAEVFPGRPNGLRGFLENPGVNSFQSGIGVLSGWVCAADTVELEIGHLGRQVAAYGTERLDTLEVCGDVDNGFGLLFNWNLLGEGEHTVVAYVDGEELGRAVVRVTPVGEGAEAEFLRGVAGECTVADFPLPGETVTLEWQQNSQNFVLTGVE